LPAASSRTLSGAADSRIPIAAMKFIGRSPLAAAPLRPVHPAALELSMTWQTVLLSLMPVLLSAVICPSVAWLIREVLSLRVRIATLEAQIEDMQTDCSRHQAWQSELQKTVGRTDRNVARLCERAGVQFDP